MHSSEQVLEIRNVTRQFGPALILDSVSLIINRRDRTALVGENGAGKTTLARIIMGSLEPDSGECRVTPGVEIGYLPQSADVTDDLTVQRLLEQAIGPLEQIRQTLARLENELAAPDLSPGDLDQLLNAYAQAQDSFNHLNAYESDYRIDQVFAGLDLQHIDHTRQVSTLSGGEQTRAMLAGLLLRQPDLLILDEPTNHLDFAALDWLESYLLTYTGALLVISHDRRFLNRVVTQIVEISPATHQLTSYAGNYDFFVAERARQQAKQRQAFEAQPLERFAFLLLLIKTQSHNVTKNKAPVDNDKFLAHFRQAQSEKGHARTINNARQRLAELDREAVERPDDRRWQINPDFEPDALTSQEVIRLTGLAKAIDGRPLFTDLSATIHNHEHIVLYGPNGLGKTTLLKVILGLEAADSGSIYVAPGARIGYLDQAIETLNLNWTVLEAFSHDLTGAESEHRSNLHKYGLFSGDQVHQPIGSLSLGQRRKLQLARLIARRANVLLLDEPTNHLDLASVEQFDQALAAFRGTILAVSHDRVFIERVGQTLWTLRDSQLLVTAGSLKLNPLA